jgi:hypothetical protein
VGNAKSLGAFVLQGVSLRLVSARSRRANYCFVSFYFIFVQKMVSVVTFGVKSRENSFGIDVGVGDIIWQFIFFSGNTHCCFVWPN